MPRQPRFVIVGDPQHVIIRGNNRDNIFNQRNDYLFFLAKLREAIEKYQCQLHAYVLMTNHVHLLISPETECAISKAMFNTLIRSIIELVRYGRGGIRHR
jgi:putative transposase